MFFQLIPFLKYNSSWFIHSPIAILSSITIPSKQFNIPITFANCYNSVFQHAPPSNRYSTLLTACRVLAIMGLLTTTSKTIGSKCELSQWSDYRNCLESSVVDKNFQRRVFFTRILFAYRNNFVFEIIRNFPKKFLIGLVYLE